MAQSKKRTKKTSKTRRKKPVPTTARVIGRKKKRAAKSKRDWSKVSKCSECGAYVDEGAEHVCVPMTEESLTENLHDELRDAWRELRRLANFFGDQRVYCSPKAIMFARKRCYMFVRPKKTHLELTFFLNEPQDHPFVKKCIEVSKTKFAHIVRIEHADHLEEPLTDWLRTAFDLSE